MRIVVSVLRKVLVLVIILIHAVMMVPDVNYGVDHHEILSRTMTMECKFV